MAERNAIDQPHERASLADAVLELACGGSELEILASVEEEWGPCSIAQVRRAIVNLELDGELVRDGRGWVRA